MPGTWVESWGGDGNGDGDGGEAVMVEEAEWEGGGARSVCLEALLVKNMSGAAPAGAGRCLAASPAPVTD